MSYWSPGRTTRLGLASLLVEAGLEAQALSLEAARTGAIQATPALAAADVGIAMGVAGTPGRPRSGGRGPHDR